MRPEANYGVDVVYAIDPSVYERGRDDDGIDRVFELDEATRNVIATVVRGKLESPRDVVELEIEPGYVRLRAEPSDTTPVKEYVHALRGVPAAHNRRNAHGRELDGLKFGDHYAGVYRPRDGREEFLDRHTGGDAAPDADGPLFEYERDSYTGSDDRHIAYEFTYPIDTGMYDGGRTSTAFEWDDDARDRLEIVVEDTPAWPGSRAGEIGRVAAHPEHITVHCSGVGFVDPADVARRSRRALERFNRLRSGPTLDLAGRTYIRAIPPADGGAEAWIDSRGLADEDGEPRDPPSADDDASAEGGVWSALNPFGA